MSAIRSAFRGHGAACAAIVASGLLLYGRTLAYGFVHYDDYELLVQNHEAVARFADPLVAFTRDLFAVLGERARGVFYRPLLVLGFGIEARLGGTSTSVYHSTNLVLHLIASCMAYAFFASFGLRSRLCLGLALCYLCHPASAMLVAWIPARNDSMLVITCTAAVMALLAFLRSGRRVHLAAAVFAYGATLFTKESGLALSGVLAAAVLSSMPLARERWRPLGVAAGAAAALTLGWMVLRRMALGGFPVGASRLTDNLTGLVYSLGNTFLPLDLAPIPDPVDATFWPGWLATGALAATVALCARRLNGRAWFGLGWYAAFLLPALLVSSSTWGLEHRISLPLIGMLLFFSQLPAPPRLAGRNFGVAIALVAAAFGALLSHARLPQYAGASVYFERAVASAPHSKLAVMRLAWLHHENARYEEALAAVERALELDPEQSEMYLLRGTILMDKGEARRALDELKRGVALDPDDVNIWYEIARVQLALGRKGRHRRALVEIERLRSERIRR